MIEPALYFALGFLSAGLIALIVAPSIWLRAVRLTRRRIEASQPLTLAEIRADRDMLRADFAVTSRRLEMNIADLRHKNADQRIEVARAQQQLTQAETERQRLVGELTQYQAELAARGEDINGLRQDLDYVRSELAQRSDLISGLEMRIGELNSDLDSRRVEISSLTTRLDAAGSRHDTLIEDRRAADGRIAALEAELERRAAVIAQERERADRLMIDVLAARNAAKSDTGTRPARSIEAQRDDNERPEIDRLIADNQALETKIRQLTRERDKLDREASGIRVRELAGPADANDIALLRDRLGDIAAQVANLAAERDGATAGLDRILATAPEGAEPANLPTQIVAPAAPAAPSAAPSVAPAGVPAGEVDDDRTVILTRGERKPQSLAERIKALRRATGGEDEG